MFRLTRHTMTLHVWSRYDGRAEVFDVLDALTRALEDMPITLPSGHAIITTIPYQDVMRASDGRTLHGADPPSHLHPDRRLIMSAQRGRDMLVKIKNDQDSFVTLAGLRTKRLRLNAATVDVTNSDSVDAWRELLPGAGVKSAEITGSGIFADSESDALARTIFFDQSVREFRFILPDFGQIDGPFMLSSVNYAGAYQGEITYELTLMSAGAPTFTAI